MFEPLFDQQKDVSRARNVHNLLVNQPLLVFFPLDFGSPSTKSMEMKLQANVEMGNAARRPE
jgi:hypothetical protein